MCTPNDIKSATDMMNDARKTEFILNACHYKYVSQYKMLFDSFYIQERNLLGT